MTDYALIGHRVLVVTTNYGVEQDELVIPMRVLRNGGAEVDVAAPSDERIQTLVGERHLGETVQPSHALADIDPAGYHLLLIPGGTLNADDLRQNNLALDTLRAFTSSGRPVAAICHGLWLLVEAGAVKGRTLTSYPSLRTDIENAGGNWVDQSVVNDHSASWPLITSRNPDDLGDFLGEVTSALALVRT